MFGVRTVTVAPLHSEAASSPTLRSPISSRLLVAGARVRVGRVVRISAAADAPIVGRHTASQCRTTDSSVDTKSRLPCCPEEESSCPQWPHKPKKSRPRYEDPSNSGVVQTVRTAGCYPANAGSTPAAGAMVVWSRWLARHPVTVEAAGSSPVTAMPRSSVARAPSRRDGGRRIVSCRGYHAPVVKRRSCRPTKPAVEVRVLPGARL